MKRRITPPLLQNRYDTRSRGRRLSTVPLIPKVSTSPTTQKMKRPPSSSGCKSKTQNASRPSPKRFSYCRYTLISPMELRKQLGPFNKEPPYKSAEVKRDSDILTILQRSKTLNRPPKLDHQFISPCKCLNPMTYGKVIGKFTYEYKGYVVDCFNGGFAGTVIPMSSLHMVTTMTKDDDALFILLVGNPDIFDMLAENEFYKRFRCIILTAEGTPEFLIKMEKALQLPVLALFNCDPHSLKTLAYYGCRLKNIKWLAIRPSDMVSHNMSVDDCTFLLTDSELTTANDLLMDEYVKNRPGWLLELNTMLRIKQKAELESLACFEISYLTQVFLPMKLQLEDWI